MCWQRVTLFKQFLKRVVKASCYGSDEDIETHAC